MKEQFKQAGYIVPATGIDTVKNHKEMIVRFDIAAIAPEEDNSHEDEFECESVRVARSAEYGDIVSAIVNDRYSSDRMQAVVNNHLLDASEEHEAEFQAMQLWRAKAKAVAKTVLGI